MPSPNDLTTLADLKAWLGMSSTNDDVLLGGLITSISTAIMSDLGRRPLQSTTYVETFDGGGEPAIVLRQWPVVALTSVTIDNVPLAIIDATAPQSGSALGVLLEPPDQTPPGRMQRVTLSHGYFPCGSRNITIAYRAGYEISGEAAVVPSNAPFTVTAAQPYGAWQSDGQVAYADGGSLARSNAPSPGVYAVSAGVYGFASADAGASVTLRYGYIPADLSRACLEWAADRYAYRSRIGQSSKSLGGQETTSFIVKDMPEFVSRLLQPYRRVVSP